MFFPTPRHVTNYFIVRVHWADCYSPYSKWFQPSHDFRSECRNISHKQHFFLELLSPGRSHYRNYYNPFLNEMTKAQTTENVSYLDFAFTTQPNTLKG